MESIAAVQFDDPHWFQSAVFYEVLVRGFRDSNGDGTGDLRGVTEGLSLLRLAGLESVARRTALELMILERRG